MIVSLIDVITCKNQIKGRSTKLVWRTLHTCIGSEGRKADDTVAFASSVVDAEEEEIVSICILCCAPLLDGLLAFLFVFKLLAALVGSAGYEVLCCAL